MKHLMKTTAEGLYERKQLLYMLVSIAVLLAGLLFALQTMGTAAVPVPAGIGYSAGMGGHIALAWDTVRFALGGLEPVGALARQVRFWQWESLFPERLGSAGPAKRVPPPATYDARLYDGNRLFT